MNRVRSSPRWNVGLAGVLATIVLSAVPAARALQAYSDSRFRSVDCATATQVVVFQDRVDTPGPGLPVVVQILIGAVLALGISIGIEYLRRPRLRIRVAPPQDSDYSTREQPPPAKLARFLCLQLENRPLPRWAKWMQRNAAHECHGQITFRDLDGRPRFPRLLSIRWARSQELIPMTLLLGQQRGLVWDPTRFVMEPTINVYPGESETFGVAARFDADAECYGWCNENYVSQPQWRQPDWLLPPGTYRIQVAVRGGGIPRRASFLLVNDGARDEFRLEEDPLRGLYARGRSDR